MSLIERPNKAKTKSPGRLSNLERKNGQSRGMDRIMMEDRAARTWPADLRVERRSDALCPSTYEILPFRAEHDRAGSCGQKADPTDSEYQENLGQVRPHGSNASPHSRNPVVASTEFRAEHEFGRVEHR